MRRAGRLLHHPLRLAGLVLLLLLLGFDVLAWRLQQGPIMLPGLGDRIAAAASKLQPGLDIRIGGASLAWEGFHSGGAPLDLRLSHILLTGQQNGVSGAVASMRVTLSLGALLHGRIAPIAVIADGAAVIIRPRADQGAVRTLRTTAKQSAEVLKEAPPGDKRATLDQLRLVRIAHARFSLDDPNLRLHLVAPDGHVLLRRLAAGAVIASGGMRLYGAMPAAGPGIPVSIDYRAVSGHGVARAVIGPGSPAALMPRMKELAALKLPVTLHATLPFGQSGKPPGLALDLALGRGEVGIAEGAVPVAGGKLSLQVQPGVARLVQGRIRLGGGEPEPPVITLTGEAQDAGYPRATLAVGIDRVEAGALPGYWPAGLAPKVRRFVLRRVSGGIARDGLFHFTLARNPVTRRIALDHFYGGFNASGVVFTWLKTMPKMTGLAGELRFPDKTKFVIDVDKGQVAGLAIHDGKVVIDGITAKDQTAVISGTLAGRIKEAAALAAPRQAGAAKAVDAMRAQLALLKAARGQAHADLTLAIPLKKHLTIRDMRLDLAGRITGLSLPLPLGRLALQQGDLRVQASFLAARLSGAGMLAGAPVRFSGHATQSGGRRYTLRLDTTFDQRLLAEAGYGGQSWRTGPVPLALAVHGGPDQAEAVLDADFTSQRFAIPALGWSKAAGVPGQARIALDLSRGRTVLRRLAIHAPGLRLAAHGDGTLIAVDAFDIGRSRATGRITRPDRPSAPWLIALAGPVLDLSGAVDHAAGSDALAPGPAAGGAAAMRWRLSGAFDRLILHEQNQDPVTALNLRAAGSDLDVAALRATALAGSSRHVELGLVRMAGSERIHLATGDAGALLRAFGLAGVIDHGRLRLDATETAGRLTGLATMTDFRLRHAPLIGKVLQGLTLYGLAEATSGPGLGFSEMVAPFTLAHQVLTIRNGRAFSPSLGFTMTGQADLARREYDLGGTIVPAYAINSLPGRLPLLGRLFRTRKGSGLFSARYTIEGPFAVPHIVINPLSVLAPGVLAGIFGSGPPHRLSAADPPVNVNKPP